VEINIIGNILKCHAESHKYYNGSDSPSVVCVDFRNGFGSGTRAIVKGNIIQVYTDAHSDKRVVAVGVNTNGGGIGGGVANNTPYFEVVDNTIDVKNFNPLVTGEAMAMSSELPNYKIHHRNNTIINGTMGDNLVSIGSSESIDNAGSIATSGITLDERGSAYDHTTVITLADAPITIGDNAALAVGSLIYTFPAGAYSIESAYMDVSITLTGIIVTSEADNLNADKLEDSTQNFTTLGVAIGDTVTNTDDDTTALVTAVGTTTVDLDTDIFLVGDEAYTITDDTSIDTDTPDVGLGSVLASGANALLSAAPAGSEDYITGQLSTDISGTATEFASLLTGGTPLLRQSGDSHALYFNAAATWSDNLPTALGANLNGTVRINWKFLG